MTRRKEIAPSVLRRRASQRWIRIALWGFGILCCAVTSVGCVTVPPYAREDLTHPGMDSEAEGDEEAFRSHVYDAREGAAGGHGSTGGGCGCN